MNQNFDYYYGNQADQFSFIRIPRVMLTDKAFSSLSIQAKVLYGVLLDRMALSRKNAWFDKENRVYIIYQIGEIMEDLGFTRKKAMELLSELEKFGLLEKKRRGHGLPNILFLKSFMSGLTESAGHGPEESVETRTIAKTRSPDFDTSEHKTPDSRCSDSGTLEVPDPGLLEVPKSAPLEVPISGHLKRYTENNKTDRSYIESNHICVRAGNQAEGGVGRSATKRYDKMRSDTSEPSLADEYRDLLRENIEYDNLLLTFPDRHELLEGILDLIVETLLTTSDEILIASTCFPSEVVRSKFLKLNYSHIRYVVDCLRENTTKVRNIKKYLLAALFNAPTTIDGYFMAEVNHDMYGYAAAR